MSAAAAGFALVITTAATIAVSAHRWTNPKLTHIGASETDAGEQLVSRVKDLGGDPLRGQCQDDEYRDEFYGLGNSLVLNLCDSLDDGRAQSHDHGGQHYGQRQQQYQRQGPVACIDGNRGIHILQTFTP